MSVESTGQSTTQTKTSLSSFSVLCLRNLTAKQTWGDLPVWGEMFTNWGENCLFFGPFLRQAFATQDYDLSNRTPQGGAAPTSPPLLFQIEAFS